MNNILTKRQKEFLHLFSTDKFLKKQFYLTGGTALAGFYLFHRYSEDLDFFSQEEVDVSGIDVFLTNIRKKLRFSKIDYQQSYNRNIFFCHFDDEILKIEFTFFPFERIEKSNSKEGFEIDSLTDIAVNKLFTIYQRSTARDYIDLYCICREKGWEVKDLITKARIKFNWHIDPLQLGTQFLKSKEAEDFPKMIKEIKPTEWRSFFVKEAKELKNEVIE